MVRPRPPHRRCLSRAVMRPCHPPHDPQPQAPLPHTRIRPFHVVLKRMSCCVCVCTCSIDTWSLQQAYVYAEEARGRSKLLCKLDADKGMHVQERIRCAGL